nr:MAG TPA: hypothetical protein [Caudoviricetes sp.]
MPHKKVKRDWSGKSDRSDTSGCPTLEPHYNGIRTCPERHQLRTHQLRTHQLRNKKE